MGDTTTTKSFKELGAQSNLESFLSGAEGLGAEEQKRLDTLSSQNIEGRLAQLRANVPKGTPGQPGYSPGADQSAVRRLESELAELKSLQSKAETAASSKGYIQQQFEQLTKFVEAGAGESDIAASVKAQRDLAAAQGAPGALDPTEQDIGFAGGIAKSLFGEERLRQEQGFERQGQETAQLAAQLGRATDDPILQAKLRGTFMQEQAALGARQGALSTQIALMRPEQRLALQQQQAETLGGLANQAFQNRTAILGLGSGLQGAEREFRLARATQTNETTSSPGALSILGAVAGGVGTLFSGAGAVAGAGGLSNLGKNFMQGTPKG